ncbi:MAG: patatin-like phospholipase family protein [Anaerolineae bacterium]
MTRILSLDGGGTGALTEVLALKALYPTARTGHDILRHFDMVVGNSGGALVAGGLAANIGLDALADWFRDARIRQQFFARSGSPIGFVYSLVGLGPRYSASAKGEAIRQRLGALADTPIDRLAADVSRTLGRPDDDPLQLLFVAFDYDLRRAFFARSLMGGATSSHGGAAPTLGAALNASTNAPVNYFDRPVPIRVVEREAHDVLRERRMWDGAIAGYNNPILAGLVEILAQRQRGAGAGRAHGPLHVLTIGTGGTLLPRAASYPNADRRLVRSQLEPGPVADIKNVATSILADPPDAATFIAHVMLGHRVPDGPDDVVSDGPVVRLNPMVQPVRRPDGSLALPSGFSAVEFDRLKDMPLDATSDEDIRLIEKLTGRWIAGDVPNQAIRANGYSLTCQIGHATFADGAARWLAM